SVALMRRSHFTLMLPSQPGTTSRSGYPCSGRKASPFWPQATRVSLSPLSSGRLRCILHASAPSQISHLACFCTPATSSSRERGTPVHSLQLASPWLACAVRPVLAPHSPP